MTEIASHRGGAALWPENSATAFKQTAALPVEQIEFDVQMSADGELVIFHDTLLDRVTNGTGPLQDKTLAELKALHLFKDGGQILTLDEGLDLLEPTHLILRCELKPGVDMNPYPEIVERVCTTLDHRQLLGRSVMTSFHLPTLMQIVESTFRPLDTMWLVSDQIIGLTSIGHVVQLARSASIDFISLHHRRLRDGVLQQFCAAELRVGAFAVLEDDAIEWAFRNDLPVFTTDRPDAAIRLRKTIDANNKNH